MLTLKGHRGAVNCLDVSAAEDQLASGADDGCVRLWDLAAGRSTRALVVQTGAVSCVAFGRGASAHNVYVGSACEVVAFDLRAPDVLHTQPIARFAPSRDDVSALTVHESGDALCAVDDAGDMTLLDAALTRMSTAQLHSNLCVCAAFRPRSHELCTGGLDGCATRFDARASAQLARWDLQPDPATCPQLVNPRHVHSVDYSPADGREIALALGDGSVELRETATGGLAAHVDAHRAAASAVRFAPRLNWEGGADGDAGSVHLISTGDDLQLRVWRASVAPEAGPATTKRRRGGGGAVDEGAANDDGAGTARGHASAALVAVGGWTLPEKPNALAIVGATACIADTSSGVKLLRMQPS